MKSRKGAIELGTSTIIIIIFAIIVLVIMILFANKYLIGTGGKLTNYSNINISMPDLT